MRAVRTHLSLPCLRKAPQISLLGGLFYFRCHLPCGKYGGICCVYSEKKQQCLTEHVACLDAPDSIVLFLITNTPEVYFGIQGSNVVLERWPHAVHARLLASRREGQG